MRHLLISRMVQVNIHTRFCVRILKVLARPRCLFNIIRSLFGLCAQATQPQAAVFLVWQQAALIWNIHTISVCAFMHIYAVGT